MIVAIVLMILSLRNTGAKAELLERIGTRVLAVSVTALCVLWIGYGHASASYAETGSEYWLRWIEWLKYTAVAICL